MTKQEIFAAANAVRERNLAGAAKLSSPVSVENYAHLVFTNDKGEKVWTKAIRAALAENESVLFPPSEIPYLLDDTVVIPSNRHIEAVGATIGQAEEMKVILFRNEHTADGTHSPISVSEKDCNISFHGGRYVECWRKRAGYGWTGMYDADRSFYGVSTCFFFDNMEGLTLTDLEFAHCAGFAVQIGDISDVVFENIHFDTCYADGLHINGNTEGVFIRNLDGVVGDDLVALNMYDWQNSSVNFGPTRLVWCEGLDQSEGKYKAMRIEPGIYYYDDGTAVDCALYDAVIKNVKGVNTFKMYYQTPPYTIGCPPERGDVGSGDNIYFEDIFIDLDDPVDGFWVNRNSDPIRGVFAGFEIGSNLGKIDFENIHIILYKEKFPLSYLVCAGPKSVRGEDREIFDPYVSCTVREMHFRNVTVNGEAVTDITPFVREIAFDDINEDGHSSGKGKFETIVMA